MFAFIVILMISGSGHLKRFRFTKNDKGRTAVQEIIFAAQGERERALRLLFFVSEPYSMPRVRRFFDSRKRNDNKVVDNFREYISTTKNETKKKNINHIKTAKNKKTKIGER